MSELRIAEGTIQPLSGKDINGQTVSSSFDYVPGSLNSAYIITSSAVGDSQKTDKPPSRRDK